MSDLQSVIATCDFVDLFVSNSFADVKGLAGVSDSRIPVPDSWTPEVEAIRDQCRTGQQEAGGPEFSILHANVVYRVTHLDSNEPGGTYVLRRSKAEIRDFKSLGIPTYFVDGVLDKKATGLIIICGGFAVGKTSTGASWATARLREHGGIALAIEDPIETAIAGIHGNGRCIAINASRHKGGYREHLLRGLRSGVDFIFLGEVRDSETAFETIKAGSNGELIGFTFHAGSPTQALERFISLAGAHTSTAAEMLADSLLAVIWQDLTVETRPNGGEFKRLSISTLLVGGSGDSGIREKIRTNQIPSLIQDIEQQANRGFWKG